MRRVNVLVEILTEVPAESLIVRERVTDGVDGCNGARVLQVYQALPILYDVAARSRKVIE